MLDVGCGWGSFPLWAATRHGASVVGITLSPPQAERARQRAEAAGVADRVEIRVMDYRDLAGERFDAIASIGMVEHVGEAQIDVYARDPGAAAGAGRAAAQPRHRPPAPHRPRGRAVLRALRLPRRRTAAPLAGAAGAGAGRLRHPPRRGVRRRLRRDPAPLGAAPRREPRRGGPARRPRTGPGLAPLPARRRATASRRASSRSTRPAARCRLRRESRPGPPRSPSRRRLARADRRRSCRWRRRPP